jgi:excisionase family DNA binding protein
MKSLLNYKAAAEYLGTTPGTLRIWVHQGRVPHFKLGTAVRFKLEDLDNWLEKVCRVEAA